MLKNKICELIILFCFLVFIKIGFSQDDVVIEDSISTAVDSLISEEAFPDQAYYEKINEENNSLWRIEEDSVYYSYSIPKEKIDQYKSEKEFQYDEKGTLKGPNLNWLDRFLNAIARILEKLFGFSISPNIFNLIKWLLIFSIGGFVTYHLLRLLGVQINFRKKKQQKSEEVSFEELEENLEEINFDQLIESAIKNQSYRVAIRLFFLKNLQSLTKRDYIEWEIDKTNNDYKYELAATKLKDEFEKTVYLFEHIWYGNFEVDDEGFHKAINHFKNFEKKIGYAK